MFTTAGKGLVGICFGSRRIRWERAHPAALAPRNGEFNLNNIYPKESAQDARAPSR